MSTNDGITTTSDQGYGNGAFTNFDGKSVFFVWRELALSFI